MKLVINIDEKTTNGDVIKAMFPNVLRSDYIENNMIVVYLNDDYEMVVSEDWWNAPYMKGDSE